MLSIYHVLMNKNRFIIVPKDKMAEEALDYDRATSDQLIQNPWNSTYAFAENDPINYIDLDGGEKKNPDNFYIQSMPRIKTMYADRAYGCVMK